MVLEHTPDAPHGGDELRALIVVERPDQAVDRVGLQRLGLGKGRLARGRQPYEPATSVGSRRFSRHETVGVSYRYAGSTNPTSYPLRSQRRRTTAPTTPGIH